MLSYLSALHLIAASALQVASYAGELEAGGRYLVAANPQAGFESPYFLSVPQGPCDGKRLALFPNNTYGAFELGPAALGLDPDDFESFLQFSSYVGEFAALDVPILTPALPRYSDVFTHAMARSTFETGAASAARVDLQALAMIEDATQKLARHGCIIDAQVIGYGFSAAGEFVTRLAALHPHRVAAVWAGGLTGLVILPVAELEGHPTTYPIGIGDLDALAGLSFDAEAFREVAIFIAHGEADDNDAISYRDSFSEAQEAFVTAVLGDDLTERGRAMARVYEGAVDDFTYRTYPGLGHSRRGTTEDALAFLSAHASSPGGTDPQ